MTLGRHVLAFRRDVKVFVAVVDSETKAHDALGAVETLADLGTVRVNASAIVSKATGGASPVSPNRGAGRTAVSGTGAPRLVNSVIVSAAPLK